MMFLQAKYPVGDKLVGLATCNCLEGDAETSSTLCVLRGEKDFDEQFYSCMDGK